MSDSETATNTIGAEDVVFPPVTYVTLATPAKQAVSDPNGIVESFGPQSVSGHQSRLWRALHSTHSNRPGIFSFPKVLLIQQGAFRPLQNLVLLFKEMSVCQLR